jgi:hypothetical protein
VLGEVGALGVVLEPEGAREVQAPVAVRVLALEEQALLGLQELHGQAQDEVAHVARAQGPDPAVQVRDLVAQLAGPLPLHPVPALGARPARALGLQALVGLACVLLGVGQPAGVVGRLTAGDLELLLGGRAVLRDQRALGGEGRALPAGGERRQPEPEEGERDEREEDELHDPSIPTTRVKLPDLGDLRPVAPDPSPCQHASYNAADDRKEAKPPHGGGFGVWS